MDYITVAETAAKWGVSERRVYRYLEDRRVKDAVHFGAAWMIPSGAEKPGDPRRDKKESPQKTLSSDLAYIIETTSTPPPSDNPDSILNVISDERLRIHYEGELAYPRGDFECTKECFRKTEGDIASRLRASSIAIAAAISTGDYPFYTVSSRPFRNRRRLSAVCLRNALHRNIRGNMKP